MAKPPFVSPRGASSVRSRSSSASIFLQVGERVLMFGARVIELELEVLDRAAQVVAALRRRLGISRIGEMLWVRDPGPRLFGRDLTIELGGILREFTDHHFDPREVAALFLGREAFETNEGPSRFHR